MVRTALLIAFICSISLAVGFAQNGAASQPNVGGDWATRKSSWLLLNDAQRNDVEAYAKEYKQFMSVAKTAMTSTHEVTRLAKAAGFTEFTSPGQVKPGARLIFLN